jgi:hypothetical protein
MSGQSKTTMRRTLQNPPDNNTGAAAKPSALARSFATRGKVQDKANDPLSLHTNQQSLILGEMMTGTTCLEERLVMLE